MKKEKLNKINVGIDDSTLYAESSKSNVVAGDSTVYAEAVTRNVGADDPVCPLPQRNTLKKQTGITLVALVITIIVMLLLSVVSINIMQNAGIIEKVKLAKEEHRASTIQEQKELFEKEIEISKYDGDTHKTINDLLNKLEEQKLITEEEKNTIMQTGRITIGTKEIIFSEDAILPDGYTRCEYLESTGTQYINTGIMGIVQKIETEFQVTKIASSQSHLFGVADSDYQNTLRFGITADNKWFFGSIATIGSTTITSFSADLLKHSLSVIVPNAILDEINIQGVGTPTLTKKPLFIFARSRQVAELFGYFKIYSFKIYQNDNLVRDYIPCLDNNNRPCMYDTVSGKTFYNQGTGEFIAGPVVE